MDRCGVCDGPLEEGWIIVRAGRIAWLPGAEDDPVGGLGASRCRSCRIGVFDYDPGQLEPVRARRTSRGARTVMP